MGIEEPKFDLHEMQMYLENKIQNVRTICDLELSENDYRRLGIKLKSLFAFATNSNFAEDFMLCIAVYWTYDFIYWDEKYAKFNAELIQMYDELSQYTQRHQLVLFKETFHDFGLNSYQIDSRDLWKDCEEISARHAGIPKDEANIVFDLLSRYLDVDSDIALNAIRPFLPKKTAHIISCLDKRMQLEVTEELQKLLLIIEEGNMTKEILMKEFPDLSVSLIQNSLNWRENQELRRYSI